MSLAQPTSGSYWQFKPTLISISSAYFTCAVRMTRSAITWCIMGTFIAITSRHHFRFIYSDVLFPMLVFFITTTKNVMISLEVRVNERENQAAYTCTEAYTHSILWISIKGCTLNDARKVVRRRHQIMYPASWYFFYIKKTHLVSRIPPPQTYQC